VTTTCISFEVFSNCNNSYQLYSILSYHDTIQYNTIRYDTIRYDDTGRTNNERISESIVEGHDTVYAQCHAIHCTKINNKKSKIMVEKQQLQKNTHKIRCTVYMNEVVGNNDPAEPKQNGIGMELNG